MGISSIIFSFMLTTALISVKVEARPSNLGKQDDKPKTLSWFHSGFKQVIPSYQPDRAQNQLYWPTRLLLQSLGLHPLILRRIRLLGLLPPMRLSSRAA